MVRANSPLTQKKTAATKKKTSVASKTKGKRSPVVRSQTPRLTYDELVLEYRCLNRKWLSLIKSFDPNLLQVSVGIEMSMREAYEEEIRLAEPEVDSEDEEVDTIPRPKGALGYGEKLKAAMKMKKQPGTYLRFLHTVRKLFDIANLDRDAFWKDQDPDKLADLSKLVREHMRNMKRYKGDWPLFEILKSHNAHLRKINAKYYRKAAAVEQENSVEEEDMEEEESMEQSVPADQAEAAPEPPHSLGNADATVDNLSQGTSSLSELSSASEQDDISSTSPQSDINSPLSNENIEKTITATANKSSAGNILHTIEPFNAITSMFLKKDP
ncbi:hypothetical protein SISSUDRAFT_1067660 [Sistotremastrum suecicum HHB10207 ss-3]|uniref:Uncharacterized protein n=1 Tax=Sistotremastrum suecicum HHB10207 ss-3 TaxID=1314776 RepID=A0A165WVD7_9AGAM|nr:hypothetical protein SISSUDRAFT_1067660 [Sistotremastrum suecicum HHB10207 ss-3]